jgi:starch synthase
MDIVLVTAEIAPYYQATSLAETAAALPKALRGMGHKVTVVAPLWASIDPAARQLARRLFKMEVEVEGQKRAFVPFEGRSSGGVDLCFLSEPNLFPADASARDTGPDTAARWGAFSRAFVQWLSRREGRPDVVHVLGWQTAVVPMLLSTHESFSKVSTALGFHSENDKGLYGRETLATFGLPESVWGIDGVEFRARVASSRALRATPEACSRRAKASRARFAHAAARS